MPPWNSILGHLLSLPPVLEKLFKDSQQSYAFGELSKNFAKSDYLSYLDLWPFSKPLIVATPLQTYQSTFRTFLGGFFRGEVSRLPLVAYEPLAGFLEEECRGKGRRLV